VGSDVCENIRSLLISESEKFDEFGYTPADVAQVVGLDNIDKKISINVEGFHTSGSPWKSGTLGAIFLSNIMYYGMTCEHVQRNAVSIYDDYAVPDEYGLPRLPDSNQLYIECNKVNDPVFRKRNFEIDVSFFELTREASLCNLVSFYFDPDIIPEVVIEEILVKNISRLASIMKSKLETLHLFAKIGHLLQ